MIVAGLIAEPAKGKGAGDFEAMGFTATLVIAPLAKLLLGFLQAQLEKRAREYQADYAVAAYTDAFNVKVKDESKEGIKETHKIAGMQIIRRTNKTGHGKDTEPASRVVVAFVRSEVDDRMMVVLPLFAQVSNSKARTGSKNQVTLSVQLSLESQWVDQESMPHVFSTTTGWTFTELMLAAEPNSSSGPGVMAKLAAQQEAWTASQQTQSNNTHTPQAEAEGKAMGDEKRATKFFWSLTSREQIMTGFVPVPPKVWKQGQPSPTAQSGFAAVRVRITETDDSRAKELLEKGAQLVGVAKDRVP